MKINIIRILVLEITWNATNVTNAMCEGAGGFGDKYLIVSMCYIGIDDFRYTSRWMCIEEIKYHTDILFNILYDYVNKLFKVPRKINLIISGHSEGGSASFSNHFFIQTIPSLQNKYNIINTYSSAGIYFSSICKEFLLTSYDDYSKSDGKSCIYNKKSSPTPTEHFTDNSKVNENEQYPDFKDQIYMLSKHVQDMVLYNFIHVAIFYYCFLENINFDNYQQIFQE